MMKNEIIKQSAYSSFISESVKFGNFKEICLNLNKFNFNLLILDFPAYFLLLIIYISNFFRQCYFLSP